MQRSCQVKKKTSDCLGCQNLLIILMKSTLFSGTLEKRVSGHNGGRRALSPQCHPTPEINLKQS